jgi:RNA polymerase sigma factor (sigma-70 family)
LGYLAHDGDAVRLVEGWIKACVEHAAWDFPSDHDDLVQDVHLRLNGGALARFGGASTLKTYVQKITKWACIDHLWECRRTVLIAEYPPTLACARPDPHEELEHSEDDDTVRRLLRTVIEGATQECRDLWRLIYFEGLRHRKVAEIMGLTVSMVKKRAFLCRKKARAALRAQGKEG